VIPKYQEFLNTFPNVQVLAKAELSEVLKTWNGLGYNRRAKFLHEAAKKIMTDFRGRFPKTTQELVSLPGIGPNTAGAIAAYAFNKPVVFIETNIRTVYIHHFFNCETNVADKQLISLIEKTLDKQHPREFYWALMDYGTFLKNTVGNAAKHSKHYAKQSKFHGSLRQIRGRVLKLLAQEPLAETELAKSIHDTRLTQVLNDLVSEKLITKHNSQYKLG
jgi:A/G-specific adenine glycosylase